MQGPRRQDGTGCRERRRGRCVPGLLVAAAALAIEPGFPAVAGEDDPAFEWVHWDEPGPDGHLRGGRVQVPVRPGFGVASEQLPDVTTVHGDVAPDHRLDIVLLGDGYTAGEQDLWAADAASLIAGLLSAAPFDRYAPLLSIHRVDLVSNESGVDHDPEFGILRDTRLDMGFWCGDIERLLCVSTGKATTFAGFAPEADLIVVVANSATYGGAGYDGIATVSARHPDSVEVLLHEIGHSLGRLGDEYFDAGTIWPGGEPGPRNVSILEAKEMAAAGTKWAAWLGEPAPGTGGPVDAYEGAFLHAEGIHRPTPDSRMRSLHRPFNPPSLEALVLALHEPVSMVVSSTTEGPVDADAVLELQTIPLPAGDRSVTWRVDGVVVATGDQTVLDLAAHGPASGTFDVVAEVRDTTSLVRDEAGRAAFMLETREWSATRTTCPGDLDADQTVGTTDLLVVLSNWGCTGCVGDLDADGSVGITDLLFLLQAWGSC